MTPQQRSALDHARRLAECGVRLFIAKPDTTGGGGHGGCGYWLPKGWQTKAVADPAVVDVWKPGYGLAAVGGDLVDVLDTDPRNGGDLSRLQMDAEDVMPTVYGTVRTPSGGTHEYIAALGQPKSTPFPGIDLQGGRDGQGIGFVWLPPTTKASKTDGVVREYTWVSEPNLAPLLIFEDTSGERLARRVASLQERDYDGPSYSGPSYHELTDGQRVWADQYVANIRSQWESTWAAAQDWDPVTRDAHGRGWEALARDWAWTVAILAATPWAGLDDDAARAMHDEVLPAVVAADPKCAGKLDRGTFANAASRPVAPPPWDDFEPVRAGDLSPSEPTDPARVPGVPVEPADDTSYVNSQGDVKDRPLTVQMRNYLRRRWDVFESADGGRVFAVHKSGGRAEPVTGEWVMRATRQSGLGRNAANLQASATDAAKVLSAFATGVREVSKRAHYSPRDRRIVLDLSERGGSARCVVVTPEGWQVQDAPPAGVVFEPSKHPLPEPVRGGDMDSLRRLLRWSEADPRWLLVKGWLPASLLAETPRPGIGCFGPQGSAKTTTGRILSSLIDPKADGRLGSAFGKNRSDDEVKALGSYVPAWDNVSRLSDEGADFLSRLVTGDSAERRKLYSDDTMIEISYRRTFVVTGVVMPTGMKADTLARFILLPFERMEAEQRVSEAKLNEEWERLRPGVLGAVLDLAAQMLARLPGAKNPRGLRMADYAEALWAIDPALYHAYADATTGAMADMASHDPFVQTIVQWLREAAKPDARGVLVWEGTKADSFVEATNYRDASDDYDKWWPRSARAFTNALTLQSELLFTAGITITDTKSNGVRSRRFEYRPEGKP